MMNRPYIICHMTVSVDGAATGDFLANPLAAPATEVYYEINREYKSRGGSGFICGRVTMEESFTGGFYPEISGLSPCEERDFLPDGTEGDGFYAVSFDPRGRLGWQSAYISDGDPGYDRARVVEVLTEAADGRYRAYLKSMNIPFITVGDEEIDVAEALSLLYDRLGIELLLLEGGSIINGHFLRAECIDELSLVEAPVSGNPDSKPLFFGSLPTPFDLLGSEVRDGILVRRYKKT